MKRLKELLISQEGWFRERVLEFAARQGGQAGALESAWPEFFADLAASAPADSDSIEYRIGDVLERLQQPAIIVDPQHNVLFLTAPAAEMVAGDVIGKPMAEAMPWLYGACERQFEISGGRSVGFDASWEERRKHFGVTIFPLEGQGCVLLLDDVTHRVEAERQLSEARNRAAHYLDVVGAILVVLDASGSVTMVNKTGCRILGYGIHELLGRDWIEAVVPEEQHDEVRDYFYLVSSGQMDSDSAYSYYVTSKDGEDLLIQWEKKLLTNEGGMPIGILCTGVDVTEQRVIEDALAEKELWLRNTFVALGEAVFILTPEMTVVDANPAAESMFRIPNQELENMPARELHIDQVHYDEFLSQSEAAFAEDRTASFEFSMRRSDGEIFPTEHSVSLIIGDDGKPLGIVNVIRDISDRKRAEQVLRESEEKFRRIFESMEEGYVVTDLSGHVLMVNPATCRLIGFEESELVGQTMERLYYDENERDRLRNAISGGKKVRGMHLKARRKDGTEIVVDANAHLVLNEESIPVGMEGTFRDITQRIEAEQVLRDREQQYRAFFENNHAIMLLTDPKTERIVDANPAASEFYGYSLKAMRKMNMNEISALSQDEMFMEMQLAREENRAYFIMQHILADRSVRDVEVYSGPIMVKGTQLLYSVIHDVTKRIRLEQEMKHLATTDALTGVANRHQFFTDGSRELRRALRYKKPMALLMLDIDYFKSINDTHGHHAGDEVLKALAVEATATLRDTDTFGRLGGEEFAVVLPEADLERGADVAERIRMLLEKMAVEVNGAVIAFTVSIGVTLARAEDKSIEDVINRADEALYKAKRMGRNRVERS